MVCIKSDESDESSDPDGSDAELNVKPSDAAGQPGGLPLMSRLGACARLRVHPLACVLAYCVRGDRDRER